LNLETTVEGSLVSSLKSSSLTVILTCSASKNWSCEQPGHYCILYLDILDANMFESHQVGSPPLQSASGGWSYWRGEPPSGAAYTDRAH